MTDAWIIDDRLAMSACTPGTSLGHVARGALYVPGRRQIARFDHKPASRLSNVQDKTVVGTTLRTSLRTSLRMSVIPSNSSILRF